eukprot:SAG31_NODE_9257_length_1307_cov_2.528974_1_plen_90_part_00
MPLRQRSAQHADPETMPSRDTPGPMPPPLKEVALALFLFTVGGLMLGLGLRGLRSEWDKPPDDLAKERAHAMIVVGSVNDNPVRNASVI